MLLIVLCVSFGFFIFGFIIGYSLLVIFKFEKEKFLDGKSLIGWFGVLMMVGVIFGGFCGGNLIEKYGRKWILVIVVFVFFVGWMMMGFVFGIKSFFIGRILCGFVSGLIIVVVFVYFVEVFIKMLWGFFGVSM